MTSLTREFSPEGVYCTGYSTPSDSEGVLPVFLEEHSVLFEVVLEGVLSRPSSYLLELPGPGNSMYSQV